MDKQELIDRAAEPVPLYATEESKMAHHVNVLADADEVFTMPISSDKWSESDEVVYVTEPCRLMPDTGEVFVQSMDDWYDYDQQKAIALPPVGVECEVYNTALGKSADWEKCIIRLIGTFKCVYDSESCRERIGDIDDIGACLFRPLDHATRKADIERKRFVDFVTNLLYTHCCATKGELMDGAEEMFKLGFKLPEDK